MGTNYYLVKNKPTTKSPLHIGKSSIGWRFLFYKPYHWETEPFQINTFEQWSDYLKEKVTSGECVIMDEYDKTISLYDFLEMVKCKQTIHSPDQFDYCENVNGYRFSQEEFS